MKVGMDGCKIFYCGVSNLRILILDDLVARKYPKEYVSFEFTLFSCE